MATVWISSDEEYPSYGLSVGPTADARPVSVDADTLERWLKVEREHQEMRAEIRDILNPPCPECGHPQARHQEWSAQWGYWGCLASGCRCQHGKPDGR